MEAGKKLPPPPGCPKIIYKLMTFSHGVRGEVQVAAINGTTDAVCYLYSVIDLAWSTIWRSNYEN